MPEITGLNLAQEMSLLRSDITILLGTGYLEGGNQKTAHQHGVSNPLYKVLRNGIYDRVSRAVFPAH
ncbi:hypothetical protein [Malonomonas rubra]|uniref:hypothetical protein n=1 Tax=Malonomonas rubra TaxID=57040 RepID=UPI0026F23327|nr:hypothetical protein [Malonomonas rubra]